MKASEQGIRASQATRRAIVLALAIAIVLGGAAGILLYTKMVAPFRTAVIVVDDNSIRMRYFLKRSLMYGLEPMSMLEVLVKEELVRQVAPKAPYNIEVSEEEVDEMLRGLAKGKNATIAENEYKEWYRLQLNESGLSKSQFGEIARTSLLALRLTDYLVQRVPTVAEQVHLHLISVDTIDLARQVRQRLKAGEDFAALARELSLEEGSKANGGDLGWFARRALADNIAVAAFDQLGLGQASEPLYLPGGRFAVVLVSERVAAREVDEDSLQRIRARALQSWIEEETPKHRVEFRGFHGNGYDSQTHAWVMWQLQKKERN